MVDEKYSVIVPPDEDDQFQSDRLPSEEELVLTQLRGQLRYWDNILNRRTIVGEKETRSDVIRHSQLMQDYYIQLIELYKRHSELFIFDDENRSPEGGTLRINGNYQGYEGQLVFAEGLIYFQRGTGRPNRAYIRLASMDKDSLLNGKTVSSVLMKGGITPLWGVYWTDPKQYKKTEEIMQGFLEQAQERLDQLRKPSPVKPTFGGIEIP